MVKMKYFEMDGETVRLVAGLSKDGECLYSLTVAKGKTDMNLEELRQFCKAMRDEIDSIAYTSPVDGSRDYSPEIEQFEEANKHAHRADANGADGD